ncbi:MULTISPECIES: DUF6059 family protein [Streptomyces]|uniref:Uncharacterized protein n=1 Tax=Streptomyces caniscabiei TaxID=2746961 RepID=A0ABU4N0N8_9ACTN|nr:MULTISPECIES: DUF6059 family protein [Streptomyces]MBE4741620.1 hypothetical protein [Streptomyces caniscabiei]MBE4761958.1 hypothetical protein [Streptomyces caniscabiei]MBE4775268.1 hypothetical protein [Streptomyces caniscabiei]MBE4790396.1 hypothetical protein [Streptomyces caniscabiei]MBE4799613.1 hypothetical protein [Streptomyces caniscabiei]
MKPLRPCLRLVRGLWDGLVVYGLLLVCGETSAYEAAARRAPLRGLPPGHPERLRTDLPLSPLERRLARELAVPAPGRRESA